MVPDKNGRTDKTFRLSNISDAKNPEIEYRFMRKIKHHRSFVEKAYQILERNYAIEPIRLRVRRGGSGFIINIEDKEKLLYSPINADGS